MEVTCREVMKVRIKKEFADVKKYISVFLNWCKLMQIAPTEKSLDVYMSIWDLSAEQMYEVQNKAD